MNENKTNINWFPGHMQKTRREIIEKIHLIDIVYEVIDSRMPISSKVVDIDDLICNKPKILVATKYDLCDHYETDKILDNYLSQLRYYQQCFSRTQSGSNRRNKLRKKISRLHRKIANKRLDRIHKFTSDMVNKNQVIITEDLNIKDLADEFRKLYTKEDQDRILKGLKYTRAEDIGIKDLEKYVNFARYGKK